MSISFGRENRILDEHLNEGVIKRTTFVPADWHPTSRSETSLIDLRSPEAFRRAFMPGSYSVPDLACVAAAKRSGLFRSRKICLLVDDLAELQLCSESDLGEGVEITGWFDQGAMEEWQKSGSGTGSIEAISDQTLADRLAAGDIVVFDIHEDAAVCRPSHPESLMFRLEDLPLSLDGLPAETSICLTATTCGLASFAASLLWNFGFHKIAYLSSGVSHPVIG